MMSFSTIKLVLREFGDQKKTMPYPYNNKVRLIISELWCLLRYGARPINYVRFEFFKKNGCERNRYLTWVRYMRALKRFGTYTQAISGKIAEYKTFANYIRRP